MKWMRAYMMSPLFCGGGDNNAGPVGQVDSDGARLLAVDQDQADGNAICILH
jgi:hypothetical protein